MTTLLAERAGRPDAAVERPGGLTLERLIASVWRDLEVRASAVCPVCGGEMSQSAPGARRGTCSTCASELA